MRRQSRLDPFANGLRQLRIGLDPGRHNDIGLDDFGPHRVRFTHNGRQRHRRMAGQAILDFAWSSRR